jgi:hypothetical protein
VGLIFDVLIPVLIILAIAFVWFRSMLATFLPMMRRKDRPGGARSSDHPRSLTSSGGFQRSEPAPQKAASVSLERRRDVSELVEDVERIRHRPRQSGSSPQKQMMQGQHRTSASPQAQMLARALGSPESTRTAFLIKEVLDPPVGMRGQ